LTAATLPPGTGSASPSAGEERPDIASTTQLVDKSAAARPRTHNGRYAAGVAFGVVSAVAYGSLGYFARVALRSGVDLPTLLAIRFSIAAIGLSLIGLIRGVGLPRGGTLVGLLAAGAAGYATQTLAYFIALTKADTGLVSVLFYVAPAMMAVASWLIWGRRLSRAGVAALVTTLLGTALAVGRIGGGTVAGVVCALLAAAIYTTHVLLSAPLVRKAGASAAAALVMTGTASVFVVASLLRGPVVPGSPAGWFAAVWLGLVSTVVAVLAFYAALERVGAVEVATVATLEPAVNLALGVTLLHERVAPVQWVGAALILAAVIGLSWSRKGDPG
jgi:drug/metabolite transporter (DMT)-like permease